MFESGLAAATALPSLGISGDLSTDLRDVMITGLGYFVFTLELVKKTNASKLEIDQLRTERDAYDNGIRRVFLLRQSPVPNVAREQESQVPVHSSRRQKKTQSYILQVQSDPQNIEVVVKTLHGM